MACRFSPSAALVIDVGSSCLYAGHAGGNLTHIVPSLVGRPKFQLLSVGSSSKGEYVGGKAQHMRHLLSLAYPVQNGVVRNWDDMELLWRHCFYGQLRVFPEEHPVLLTEAIHNPLANREKMVQLMFETFEVPATYVASQPLLVMMAEDVSTGLSLCIGDGVLQAMPLYEHYILEHGTRRKDLAGSALTDFLRELLLERGHDHTSTTAEREVIREIKERMCYVALDFEAEMSKAAMTIECEKSYELPDGQVITLGNERFRCAEPLFQPNKLLDTDMLTDGVHKIVYDAVMQCPIDTRKDLLSNIVVAGGTSMLPGFEERLVKELTALLRANSVCKQHSVFYGGSALCSLSTFEDRWLDKETYEEYGPAVGHQCL
ncbi:Actin, aortic smooth muscle [Balamuthia mandrillaris]